MKIVRAGKKYFLILLLTLSVSGCSERMHSVDPDIPGSDNILSSKEDIIIVASEFFRVWFNAIQDYKSGCSDVMSGMADQMTMGASHFIYMCSEPRLEFLNSISYRPNINQDLWDDSYRTVSFINDVLNRLADASEIGLSTEDADMLGAWCYFCSGIIHGYLALNYDKAIILDHTSNVTELTYKPYNEVGDAALGYLDKAIDISGSGTWTLPDDFISGYNLSAAELKQLANSYAARIMTYIPRNAEQNSLVDWSGVLQYAQNGIDWTLAPEIYLNNNGWDDNLKIYGIYPGWLRIDHRIINLMDHDYPSRWPTDGLSWNTPDGNDPGPAGSADQRLTNDFEYCEANSYNPDNGYYHFSHYRYARFDDLNSVVIGNGPAPIFRKWENDLLIAEAKVRANSELIGALNILNDPAGARKSRGGLADIESYDAEEILEFIFYERDIELILTQGGTSFYDMRRRDMLQEGTILHFPIPASELALAQEDWYTISGTPDGINISAGGWKGYDELVSGTVR